MPTSKSNTKELNKLQCDVINGLRFVMACLVVMIHVDGGLVYDGYSGVWNGSIYDTFHIIFAQGICRIAVPSFFLISGYLYFSRLSEWDTKIYLQKELSRVKSLLVPYLIWNIIAILLFIAVKCIKNKVGMDSFSSFWKNEGGLRMLWDCNRVVDDKYVNILGMTIHHGYPFNIPLWFIRDLFIMTLLSPAVYWLIRHFGKVYIALITILMIFNIWLPFEGISSLAFAFFSIGAYLKINNQNLVIFCRNIKTLSYLMTIILVICTTLLCGYYPFYWEICQRLLALFGFPVFVNLTAKVIERGRFCINEKLSRCSFFIYAGQRLYVIPFAVILAKIVLPFDGQLIAILHFLISSALVVAICAVIYFFMKKYMPRTTNLLTGGR